MAKQVRTGENIYIVPGIIGTRDGSDELVITVESNGEQLFPKDKIEDKIRIFKSQVNGWFLEQAHTLLWKEDKEVNEDNGFVILMIATAYIEGVEQLRQGESSEGGKSKEFFKIGVKRIFEIDSSYDDRLLGLYKELRCGLFHNGMTGPNIRIFSTYDKPIDFSNGGKIKINQKLFLEKVKDDFNNYLEELKDKGKKELRTKFDNMYKFI